MAAWNRLKELLRGEKKDFRVKKIECLYREEGTCGGEKSVGVWFYFCELIQSKRKNHLFSVKLNPTKFPLREQ